MKEVKWKADKFRKVIKFHLNFHSSNLPTQLPYIKISFTTFCHTSFSYKFSTQVFIQKFSPFFCLKFFSLHVHSWRSFKSINITKHSRSVKNFKQHYIDNNSFGFDCSSGKDLKIQKLGKWYGKS